MAKVLVTGGAGFIGSNLVDELISKNHKVVVIDNESSSVHDQFYFNPNAEYHRLDIADYEATRPLYNDVDYVFHCAAESRIQLGIDNPMLAVRTNTFGTSVVLQCAREAGVKKLMYSSTSSGYGRKNKVPYNETMPDDCLNTYSVSKVSGEKLCSMYSQLYGLNTVIFRYFNVYGSREPLRGHYAPVIGLFLRQHFKGESLTVVGTGDQRRDFTSVIDVVRANMLAMTVDHEHYGEVFNIGSGVNFSINEIAHMISDQIVYIPPRPGEAIETLADTTKAHTILGWYSTGDIKKYIAEKLNEK